MPSSLNKRSRKSSEKVLDRPVGSVAPCTSRETVRCPWNSIRVDLTPTRFIHRVLKNPHCSLMTITIANTPLIVAQCRPAQDIGSDRPRHTTCTGHMRENYGRRHISKTFVTITSRNRWSLFSIGYSCNEKPVLSFQAPCCRSFQSPERSS